MVLRLKGPFRDTKNCPIKHYLSHYPAHASIKLMLPFYTQAARGDTVCMCASMGMLGMGQFSYDLGFTKMCGTCEMQLKPR